MRNTIFVRFNHTRSDGTKIRVTSKDPMMIGYEYWYLLYKVPHMRCPGVGFVNQFGTPVKPSSGAKVQYPFARVPIRKVTRWLMSRSTSLVLSVLI